MKKSPNCCQSVMSFGVLTYSIEKLTIYIYIYISYLRTTMLSAMSSLQSKGSGKIDVAKAEELLSKADDEMSIVGGSSQ